MIKPQQTHVRQTNSGAVISDISKSERACQPDQEAAVIAAPCVILGMHRSGTSFAARWLKSISIYLGGDMLGGTVGNVDGHYEDREFLKVNRQVLFDNRCHWLVDDERLILQPKHHHAAARLFRVRRGLGRVWGWKDPRTCLAMDLWCQNNEPLNLFCMHRDCESVVDSILRRHAKEREVLKNRSLLWRSRVAVNEHLQLRRIQRTEAQLFTADRIARSWVRHNEDMLDAVDRGKPNRALVLSVPSLIAHWPAVIDQMQRVWKYPISLTDPSDLFSQAKFKEDSPHVQLERSTRELVLRTSERLEAAQTQTLELLGVDLTKPR